MNYISRPAATCYQEAYGVTVPPGQTHAQATWRKLTERETEIRKNGRVCDKFIIAIPVEMTQEQAIHTVRRFGNKIAHVWDKEHGRLMRGSYFFTLQDWGTHNPHCHFVFVDADQETGKRVFGTTKNGSTNRLRAAWEATCNGELERLGIEARIDRRPQHVIEAERASEAQLSDEAGQLPVPPDAPAHQLEESSALAHEQELVQEDDMATQRPYDAHMEAIREAVESELEGKGRITAGEPSQTVADRVRGAHQLGKRIKEMKREREALTKAQDRRYDADQAAIVARQAARDVAAAEDALEPHKRFWGLAGFQVWGWKSPARRVAEKARDAVEDADKDRRRAEELANDREAVAQDFERSASEAAQKVEGYEEMTSQQRREVLKDMERFEEQVEDSRAEALEPVTPEDIYTSYKADEISAEEALAAAESKGYDALAQTLKYEIGREFEAGDDLGSLDNDPF